MIARACPVPGDALLHAYVDRAGTYTDCFEVMHPGAVDLNDFIAAFYATWLFRLERFVLTLTQRRRITDADVKALATGAADRFAVWTVEARTESQVLLCDASGHTRSYLAVAPKEGGVTRLIFGSAVVARPDGSLPTWVRVLMPLHRLYSKALLRLAERRMRFT